MRKNLKACSVFHSSIPLREIVCSAEDKFTIKNNYPDFDVCYFTTLHKFLLPMSEEEALLDQNAIRSIKDFLLEHQENAITYDLFQPHGELVSGDAFIDSFSDIAADIIVQTGGEVD